MRGFICAAFRIISRPVTLPARRTTQADSGIQDPQAARTERNVLSIIIPAHDEAPVIGATLDAVAGAIGAADDQVEVIVVDDASTDATAAIARARGARVVQVDVRHIAGARNAGAAVARGDR